MARTQNPDGTYKRITHWGHTVNGQLIKGQLLKHECQGASDYCMHCGIDMCSKKADEKPFCDVLNDLAYGTE